VKGVVALQIVDTAKSRGAEIFGPQVLVEGHIKKSQGRSQRPVSLFGVSGIEGVRGTHIRDREVVKPEIPFRVKVVVTSVGHVGKSWRLVLVRTGVTPKKDLWITLVC
jgi:hypothetical protein